MSIEGQSLLLKIEALIKKASIDRTEGSDVEITYSFDRPDINIKNSLQLLGIVSLTIKDGPDIETSIIKLVNNQEFIDKLIDVKGSNSIKEDLEKSFADVISGKTPNLPKHTPKSKEIKRVPLKDIKGRFYSITNLKAILNQRIALQVKENMGKGSAKSILNYRSGRFSNSVTIKNVRLTKDGKLEVFYDYMKYPYQTFEPGFKQGFPSSRDPKLLISKSIREIATSIVINKLKATLV